MLCIIFSVKKTFYIYYEDKMSTRSTAPNGVITHWGGETFLPYFIAANHENKKKLCLDQNRLLVICHSITSRG